MAGLFHRWGTKTVDGTLRGATMRRVHLSRWTVLVKLPAARTVLSIDARLVENVERAGPRQCQVVTTMGVMLLPFLRDPVRELVNEIKTDWQKKMQVEFALLDRADDYAARMEEAARRAAVRSLEAERAWPMGQVSGASGEQRHEAIA